MRLFLSTFTMLFMCTLVCAQHKPFVCLEIDRIAIKKGQGLNYQWEWEEDEATQWGLIERHRKCPYDDGFGRIRYTDHSWWIWEDEKLVKETLLNGSVRSSSKSSFLNISLNLHPECLILSVENLTNHYIVIDLSSMRPIHFYPPEPNLKRESYDILISQGLIMNYYGSQYSTVILPPFAEIDVPYHNKFWKGRSFFKDGTLLKTGEDRNIICEEIANGSRVDLCLSIGIFRDDPLERNKAYMKKPNYEYCICYESPIEFRQKNQGAYFKVDSAYYIEGEYDSLFDEADMSIQAQIICRYTRSSYMIPTKQNKLGFLMFDGNFETSSEMHYVP